MKLGAFLLLGFLIWAGGQPAPCDASPAVWSEAVNGLRGRLVITDVDNQGKPGVVRAEGGKSFCVYIELQNVAGNDITVLDSGPYTFDNPEYEITLTDSHGLPIDREKSIIGLEVLCWFHWLLIQGDSTMRLRLAAGSFNETRADGECALGLTFDKEWILSRDKSRSYFLSCVFRPEKGLKAAIRAQAAGVRLEGQTSGGLWEGVLELPRVAIPLPDR